MREILSTLFTGNSLLYIAMSLLPILAWLYFFQKKHPEKRSYVLLTFVAGMLAVIPIKLYEAYWDTAVFYFQHANLFQYIETLAHLPNLSKFLAYITINALVGVGFFVFTGLLMFLLEIGTRDNTLKVFKTKVKKAIESPLFFISIGILCGIVAFLLPSTFNNRIWFFVVVGMLEEFVKHLVLRFSNEEKVRSVDDALSFAIIVALGFSFVENIVYFHNFASLASTGVKQLSIFFVLRSTISVMAHVCFSAILGYFYGVAKFSREIYQQEVQQNKHPIIKRLHKLVRMKGSTLFHEEKMMEGMLLAMICHAVFNWLLEMGQVTLMIPFLMVMFFIVLSLFHRKKIQTQTGILARQALPPFSAQH